MQALDFPDARWLDLALSVRDGGRTMELRDRAPDGTRLVAPPSACRAREALLDDCEAKLAVEPNPESFGIGPNGVEGFRFFHGCALRRDADGKIRVARDADTGPFWPAYPATLHDCAGGRARIAEMEREVAGVPSERAEARASVAFFDKACRDRGVWTWKVDRFVKSAP
jgi:hypothetical protein